MDSGKKSVLLALSAVLLWSTVPTAFKISLSALDILPMLTIASLTSTIVLLIIVTAEHKLPLFASTTGRDLISSAILGLINPFLYYLILLRAYQLLPAQVAQPLNMIWPIVLVFLSVPVLGQKIRKKSFYALLISFAGVYIISSQGSPFKKFHSDLTGVLLATGSSLFWSVYFIFNVRDKRDESVKLLLNFIFGSVFLVLAMSITGKWEAVLNVRGILASVYIGIFEMGVTFYLWLKALQTAPDTAKVSNLVYLAPFLSLIFVHYIINEPVYYTTPIGLGMIITGILLQSKRSNMPV